MSVALERKLRVFTGLVLVVFLVLHLTNAGLGLWSFEAMESLRHVLTAIWGFGPLQVLLYGSFLVHFLLALASLYRRRSLAMPAWEAMQLVFGLSILPLMFTHMLGTRMSQEVFGADINYPLVVSILWGNDWYSLRQMLLLTVAWFHAMMGLHFWLRIKSWYPGAFFLIYPLAVLLPVIALAGFARSGAEVQAFLADPATEALYLTIPKEQGPIIVATVQSAANAALGVFYGAIGLVLLARIGRSLYWRKHGGFVVCHAYRKKPIRGLAGQTVLESLREARVPHASVCGGRARCTTCRVRVGEGIEGLHEPGALESKALKLIKADPNVRLACQLRPHGRVHITPLVSASAGADAARLGGGVGGREQRVVCMFVDMRGSTRLGESKLPYDVVFILNQFFAELSAALSHSNGHYAQFNGDGLMALYGLKTGLRDGCRDALEGAAFILRRINSLNDNMASELNAPIRVGIGIHSGMAIVGTMGPPDSPIFSAIGDNINIAARLEALTKECEVPLIASEEVFDNAGIPADGLDTRTANVRGRGEPVAVVLVPDPCALFPEPMPAR